MFRTMNLQLAFQLALSAGIIWWPISTALEYLPYGIICSVLIGSRVYWGQNQYCVTEAGSGVCSSALLLPVDRILLALAKQDIQHFQVVLAQLHPFTSPAVQLCIQD